ncbi:MAG: YggS family pyridoxal phosphate-dependent enzyme [bacterium]
MDEIKRNVELIKSKIQKINSAAVIAGVTKTVSLENIEEAIKAGITIIAESKIQEAEPKVIALKEKYPQTQWHFIGHLQSNKVNKTIKYFKTIQSVDSFELAKKISEACLRDGLKADIYLEAKVSLEENKFGINPDMALQLAQSIKGLETLRLKGIMTIPPFLEDKEALRPYFKKAKLLFDEIKRNYEGGNVEMQVLSMGMTDDFEIALEEGSNMVRIGTGIFGKRNYTQ